MDITGSRMRQREKQWRKKGFRMDSERRLRRYRGREMMTERQGR